MTLPRRAELLLTLALLLPAASAQTTTPLPAASSAVTLQSPQARQARPGEYVTLAFLARGNGEFEALSESAAGWVAVTPKRRITLNGETLIPVTFRVPPLTPAGTSAPLILRVVRAGETVAQAQTTVQVLEQANLALSGPGELTAQSASTATFALDVKNLGNKTDTARLEVTNLDPSTQLSVSQVTLQPGETRSVNVTVKVGSVSPNYQYTSYFRAVSVNDPAVKVLANTDLTFNPVASSRTGPQDRAPTLALSVHAQAELEGSWSAQGQALRFGYSLQPSLSGQLSDYATGEAALGGLDGDRLRPWPSGLSASFRVRLKTWDVGMQVSRNSFSVGAARQVKSWLLSTQASYRRFPGGQMYGVSVGTAGQALGGQVRAVASSLALRSQSGTDRSDSFRLSYSRNLGPRWGLLLSGGVNGQTSAGGYHASVSGYQQVSYAGERFDFTQSYSGSSDGLHSVAFSAGLKTIQPFLLRGAAYWQWMPGGATGNLSGLVGYTARSGLGVAFSGRYTLSTNAQQPREWELTTSLNVPARRAGPFDFSVAAQYSLASVTQPGYPTLLSQGVQVDSSLVRGPLNLAFQVNWTRSGQGEAQKNAWRFETGGSYALGLRDQFLAGYTFERVSGSQAATRNVLRAEWQRAWNARFASNVSYAHAVTARPAGVSTGDNLSLGGSVHDLFVPGLTVGVAYTLGLSGGVGQSKPASGVKVSLGYDLARFVKTPARVVNAFGGRIGGDVHGTLYRDDNLNGQRDPGEAGLGGVQVRVQDVTVTTSADGQYRLHVPVGSYDLSFPAGLPATIDALKPASVQVSENSVSALDVPFAPVGMLETQIFTDNNRNGVQDADEGALPYAVATLSGPVTRTAHADAQGKVRVSSLPTGTYLLSLESSGLPSGYTMTTTPQTVQVQAGQRQGASALGASLPAREMVNTYTASNIALMANLSSKVVEAGAKTTLKVRLQNAQSVTVTAFGQAYTPVIANNAAELTISVPQDTAPGEYDITIQARNAGSDRTNTIKVIVSGRP